MPAPGPATAAAAVAVPAAAAASAAAPSSSSSQAQPHPHPQTRPPTQPLQQQQQQQQQQQRSPPRSQSHSRTQRSAGGLASAKASTATSGTSVASRESARAEARTRLAALLRYPEDLSGKLDALRTKLVAERAAIDAQLKAGTQGQLDDCELGLENLALTRSGVDVLRARLAAIVETGDRTAAQVGALPRLRVLSTVNTNLRRTFAVVRRFMALSERIDYLSSVLDAHASDLLGPAPDLLFLHQECIVLLQFRERTLSQARAANRDIKSSVKSYFRRLDALLAAFREYQDSLARNLLELVAAGRQSVIVRLAKTIVYEENLLARHPTALSSGSSSSLDDGPAASQPAAGGDTFASHESVSRFQHDARVAFFESVHASIVHKFEILLESNSEDIAAMLSATLETTLADLSIVFDNLTDLFPRRFKIFPFFVLEYHRNIFDLLNKVVANNLDTAGVLAVLRWVTEYYAEMNDKLGIGEDLLEPRLLDGQEQILISDYLKLVAAKFDEWMRNLLATESRDFIERTKPPECDSQGAYVLSCAALLFSMVNQQIDVASETSRGHLLSSVILEAMRSLASYQTHFTQLAQQEYTKFSANPNTAAAGLLEYTMALANDAYKCTEYLDLVGKRMETEADSSVRDKILDDLSKAHEGFMRLMKSCVTILIDAAYVDVKSAFALLFTNPPWYNGDVMTDIVATLRDYCSDYAAHLQEYVFGKLVTDLMERFLSQWVLALHSKNARFRTNECRPRMDSDSRLVIEFFSAFKSQKRVEKHFLIMERLFTLCCSNPKFIFLDYYALRKLFNDVPLSFIEDLLHKRDDMDKASVRDAIASIEQKSSREDAPIDSQKSIFSTLFPSTTAATSK